MALSTGQLRRAWGPACPQDIIAITFGGIQLNVRNATHEAFLALLAICANHGYVLRQGVTGAYNCRRINHNPANGWSLHAFGIAGDLNWDTNPYSRRFITDMPPAMITEVLALRTQNGKRVFRWGGDWDYLPNTPHTYYDAMHFEIVCTPADLATGITQRPNDPEGDEMREGEQGDHVAEWQETINVFLVATGSKADDRLLLGLDGSWGPKTTEAMAHVIERLRRESFHQLGDYPIALSRADPQRAGIGLSALVGAAIAEREANIR